MKMKKYQEFINESKINEEADQFVTVTLGDESEQIKTSGEATNFDIRISKEEAERLINKGRFNDDGWGSIMCKEYGDGEDWQGMFIDDIRRKEDGYSEEEDGKFDEDYQTFEIWLGHDAVSDAPVNESVDSFNDILNMPLEQRQEIQAGLEEIAELKKNEGVNEGLGDIYRAVVGRLKKWLGKQAVTFLINLSQQDIGQKIDMLKMLDPSYFSDIGKTDVIYLGGGIDKTSEEGAAGWRDSIEEYFGMDHVVQGQDMIDLAKDGKLNTSKYPKPLIMNPMRNELVRTNDPRFSEIFRKWKAGELDKVKDHEDWKYWANVINKEIHAPDLRIVNACDTNLVKLDPGAGAGTLGEMQVSALRGLNLFVWLDNGYTVKDISPWLIPTVTKLVRNDEELKILLENIDANTDGSKPDIKEPEVEEMEMAVENKGIKTYEGFLDWLHKEYK